MAEPMSLSTSPTLLDQLRVHPGDRGAWEEFVGRYAPRIRAWCRRSGLQEADVEDAVQAVLARLARGMTEFRYDPSRSFRAYLKSLTRYAVCDLRKAAARPDAGCGGSRVAEVLAGVRARDDLMRHLEHEFDFELLREAMRRASRRVEPTTWEAFRLVIEDGLPSREAADRLGIKVARVYVAKSRVLALVKQEIRALEGDPEVGDPEVGVE